MARMARLVVPGYPHHVTQRGSRRQTTFFCSDDYEAYLRLLAKAAETASVDVWAYCLMPNHVHLILVPADESGLAAFLSEAHRRYARRINAREGWRGHLWQERFYSCVMDERHLLMAARYVELNPVRSEICQRPEQWKWSSVHAHLKGHDDSIVKVAPMLERVGNWREYLEIEVNEREFDSLREHSRSGRPIGDSTFVEDLERWTGRRLRRAKPGPRKVD